MTDDLDGRTCKPCEGGMPPLTREQSDLLLRALHEGWLISDDGLSIMRRFEFHG